MNAVIIFSKIPIPGTVKTRLIGNISAEEAALLARYMLLDLFEKLRCSKDYDVFIAYAPTGKLSLIINDIPENFGVYHQVGDNMGSRMYNAMEKLFSLNYDKVLLIGSDIPNINHNIINDSFKALEDYNMVLNPTFDGGYYLIGASDKRKIETLLKSGSINWSTLSVFESSLEMIKENNWTVHVGETLPDIDNMEDLICLNNFDDLLIRTVGYILKLKRMK